MRVLVKLAEINRDRVIRAGLSTGGMSGSPINVARDKYIRNRKKNKTKLPTKKTKLPTKRINSSREDE